MRGAISGFAGGPVLAGVRFQACRQSFSFYQEHYVWRVEKYGVLTPLRWQDIVIPVAFWLVAIGLLYLSHRLLKNALRWQRSIRSSDKLPF